MPRLVRQLAALRRFARARKGATAIEFALVAVPMLMLVFGVLELGLVLLVSTTLDTAVDFTSRDIRTGRFQQSGAITAKDFEAKVCRNMNWLGGAGCANAMSVEAETFATFAAASASEMADPAAMDFENDTPRCWSVGTAGDIVLVRIYYTWPIFTPLLSGITANGADGKKVITATRAFLNEPFNSDSPNGAQC